MPSRSGHSVLPRYVTGPKPKRRTELGLLVFGALLISSLYVIAELGAKSKIPPHIGYFLGILLGLSLVAHMANRWLIPQANAVILPLAVLLNGIGYVVIARWNPITLSSASPLCSSAKARLNCAVAKLGSTATARRPTAMASLSFP